MKITVSEELELGSRKIVRSVSVNVDTSKDDTPAAIEALARVVAEQLLETLRAAKENK